MADPTPIKRSNGNGFLNSEVKPVDREKEMQDDISLQLELKKLVAEEIKLHKGNKIIGRAIWVGFIIIFVVAISLVVMFIRDLSQYNKGLISLVDQSGFKTAISDTVRNWLRSMELIAKTEHLPWVAYTEQETRMIVAELAAGEVNYNMPYKETMALIAAESFGCKLAKSGVSAVGLCQLMPDTRKEMLDELCETDAGEFDVSQNIRMGLRYFNKIKWKLKKGTDCYPPPSAVTIEYILWGYNAGWPQILSRKWWINPEYVYDECKDYVKKFYFYRDNYNNSVYDVYYYKQGKRYMTVTLVNQETNRNK